MARINFQVLRDNNIHPRVHGNGFLQLDLAPDKRLHIWGHRSLPRQRVDTGIHDHRFSFDSTVLVGRLINAMYEEGNDRCYKVYRPVPREGEDTLLQYTGRKVFLDVPDISMFREGESYRMSAEWFHESFTDRPSATIMEKRATFNREPSVLCPLNQQPDNDFNRYTYSKEDCWGIIRDVLGYD